MTTRQAVSVFYWIIRDVFSQALASRTFWVMFSVTVVSTLFCLGVRIEGADTLTAPDDPFLAHPKTGAPLTGPTQDLGTMHLLFGAMRVSLPRDRASGVELLHVVLGSWVAGAVGVLLTLVWAATLVPEMLQPGHAALLLTKPPPGWVVLMAKYLGVVVLVAVQALLFFVATWAALGLSTGVWRPGYLAGAPLMVLHFASLYGFAVVLGVVTRSGVASVLGTMLFWAACVSINSARVAAIALPHMAPEAPQVSPLGGRLVEVGYWALPKPLDYVVLLEQALDAKTHMATLSTAPEMAAFLTTSCFHPVLIILATVLSSCLLLVLAGSSLSRIEY